MKYTSFLKRWWVSFHQMGLFMAIAVSPVVTVLPKLGHATVVPFLTNPDNSYNRLKFAFEPHNYSSDTTFTIAVSDDDFATTWYVRSDTTVGRELGVEDSQTFLAWGGERGFFIQGLNPNTLYSVKVKALLAHINEVEESPVATATTSTSMLSSDIDVAATDSESPFPYTLELGELQVDSVATLSQKVWVDFETNHTSGGRVYIGDETAGLSSPSTSQTIPSQSDDLTLAKVGYGIQGKSPQQLSGGSTIVSSPYNGAENVVGGVSPVVTAVFSSVQPIVSARAFSLVKIKAGKDTMPVMDYIDALTFIVSPNL